MHGDFHTWNILFREGTDFSVLDRSRGEWGEWGEAVDDVICLALNVLAAPRFDPARANAYCGA